MAFTWGIVGTGKIAKRFAADLLILPEAKLVGAAGRSLERTETFCREFGIKPFSSVEELLSSNVQIIYIATPHSEHHPLTMDVLARGKAVLCEKPFAMNVAEAKEMIAFAREKKVFLMEAMWTRFFPAIREVVDLVKSGAIGEIKEIDSCFGFHSEYDPRSRLYDISLGGGSLLDVGIYCLTLTRMLTSEEPELVFVKSKLAPTGVDVEASWEHRFPSGIIAKGRSSIVEVLTNEARISGTKGEIRIPKFWCPKEYSLNGVKKEFSPSGMGLHYEATEVMDCLSKNRIESPLQSHAETLAVMNWMEKIISLR